MIKIGITGSLASGKTTASKILSFKKGLYQPYVIILFSLLSFMFINIFFYRIGEHGTDRSAQILVMLLIIEIIDALQRKNFNNILNLKIFTLVIFIISLKAFYILYLLLLLPLYYSYYKLFKSHGLVIKNFLSGYLFFYFFIFLLILSSYFFNTGCLIYPVQITCFDNLSWSIPIKQVEQMSQWYQQWSKPGAAPGFRVDNPDTYIGSVELIESNEFILSEDKNSILKKTIQDNPGLYTRFSIPILYFFSACFKNYSNLSPLPSSIFSSSSFSDS